MIEDADIGRALDEYGPTVIWDESVRGEFEARHLAVVPTGFYYPIPTDREIAEAFEYREDLPFNDSRVFDRGRLEQTLRSISRYAPLFEAAAETDIDRPDGYAWNLPMFGYTDAVAYYSMIRIRRPEVVVEVGSGYSTLIALQAVAANGKGSVVCIEPFPRAFLRDLPVSLLETAVQDLPPEWFAKTLGRNGLLFVDSTHAVKAGSDCLHIYLRVLPGLRERVLVHVHDVHLPRGVPSSIMTEHRLYWLEQYLLYAYLLENRRAKVLFGSQANMEFFPDLMRAVTPSGVTPGGVSLWFELAATGVTGDVRSRLRR